MSATADLMFEDIAADLVQTQGCERGSMFNMPWLKTSGEEFAGRFGDAMVFRLPAADHAEALALEGARLFDPAGGRPMKRWVEVPFAHAARWPDFARAALGHVSTLVASK